MPLISIITACYNAEDTVAYALDSLDAQHFRDLEHIVIDGGSKDATLNILDKAGKPYRKVISEPDDGIYDAINKGIAHASGEVIGLLHADDFYPDDKVLNDVSKRFEQDSCEALYGDLQYVHREDPHKVFRHWRANEYREGLFQKGWMPPHPAFFIRRALIDLYGAYDPSFQIAADYEFMLRMICRCGVHPQYVPRVLMKMRVGGKSNVSLSNRLRANREDRLAWKVNGLKTGILTSVRKPLGKLKQFKFR